MVPETQQLHLQPLSPGFVLLVATLWWRDIVRFFRQPSRVIGALGTPLVLWLLIGSGFGGSFRAAAGRTDAGYLEYFFPGTVMMILLFSSIFSSMSVIEDRHEGFLLSALVAPISRDDVDREFAHLGNLHRVVQLQELFASREKVGILLQPDPDPDGIASGLALRALLGRRSPTAPLVSFGAVTRPENQAMVKALGVEVRTITPVELDELDGLALVDVQPSVFGDPPPLRVTKPDVVIDHHPERAGWDAPLKDLRTAYGATSTILTEYIQASGIEVRPKLATALLYGIKSDTQLLGRDTSSHDIGAFAFVHTYHSPALLRRIERPALPSAGLRALGRALSSSRIEEGIHLLVLGRVREDVIPQVADLGLQAEGAEWAIAAGVVGSDLVFSVRNVGYVRAAGDVVRAVVEGMGLGGGHRSMAKGIIPLKAFRQAHGNATRQTIGRALFDAFVKAIHEPS
jgi:nanoRNase/pAp phosphatase (c-di-AMP/oligoRNAs hydrolase)